MELGLIGLGRMGGNMAQRLLGGGHTVVVFDLNAEAVKLAEGLGARNAASIEDLVSDLGAPRVVWVMLPPEEPTEQTIQTLGGLLSAGDVIIDGGNANYRDSMRRAAVLKEEGIAFLDAGTSGGIWGLKSGYALMVGGDKVGFDLVKPILQTLAPGLDQGYAHVGPSGAGHFVKMVHNGIEYGMMQAYAEGFQLLHAKEQFGLNLAVIAELWRHGGVVRSWLLDLTADALKEDPSMANLQAYVEDSGEGRWVVEESIALAMPTPVITLALQERFRSRQVNSFADRILAALRNKFGGHAVRKISP